MARGRKPTPTAVQHLRGNPRKRTRADLEGARGVERALPAAPVKELKPPLHLPADAKSMWRKLARLLQQARVLKETDVYTLECACVSFARFREAERLVAVDGLLVVEDTRYGSRTRANPAVGISNKERTNYRQFMGELGLSPAARARLEFEVDPAEDPLGALMQMALDAG